MLFVSVLHILSESVIVLGFLKGQWLYKSKYKKDVWLWRYYGENALHNNIAVSEDYVCMYVCMCMYVRRPLYLENQSEYLNQINTVIWQS